ncbi:hypothetical protein V6N11_077264 [Hibiscus sabdariffa]|uniref:Uncharacterized protein n=1 Tax=Hibiscus sabdariffa TaxID=183260 RepID=A0ABR2TCK4_9ROSI
MNNHRVKLCLFLPSISTPPDLSQFSNSVGIMFDCSLGGVEFLFLDVMSFSSSVRYGESTAPKLKDAHAKRKEQLWIVVGKIVLPPGKCTTRGA